jgi:hypothetical protein
LDGLPAAGWGAGAASLGFRMATATGNVRKADAASPIATYAYPCRGKGIFSK